MHSIEVRKLVINIYYKLNSMRKVKQITNISISSISRWLKRIDNKHRKSSTLLNSPVIIDIITVYLKQNIYATVQDIQNHIFTKLKLKCSHYLIRLIMKKLNLTYKKTKFSYYLDKNLLYSKTKQFITDFKNIQNSPLTVFLDEVGFSSKINPLKSWSIKGQKTYINIKHNTSDRKNKSVCSYITSNGIIKYHISNNPFTTQLLLDFIKTFDFPINTTIIFDNVSFHRSKIISNFIEERGWNLLFTPPYSPWFNPIENIFSVIKNNYRKYKNIDNSFKIVTSQMIINCINHAFNNYYI